MSLGFGFGFTKITAAIRAAFSPSSLFAANEPGVWYDPSDLSTLFQDAAGTTPVTAVEQPVGLMLDKSKGLTLGSERFPQPSFDATTGLTLDSAWVVSGGVATANGITGFISVPQALQVGKWYSYSIDVVSRTSGEVYAPYDGRGVNIRMIYAPGTYRGVFLAEATTLYIYSRTFVGSIDNISVRELPGNHASQTTATSRPVLSARVNQYLATETLATQNVTTLAAQYLLSFEGAGTITLSGTATGVYSAGSHLITCTAGTLTSTVSGSVTKADLRVANNGVNLPPYQRVNTATDYDTAGFPHYLRFDGVDDWLVTNTITPGTDKVQVFAGVRKLSDASIACVAELSNTFANTNVFMLYAPDIAGSTTYHYEFGSNGTLPRLARVSSAAYAAPTTNILTGLGDISGDSAILRVNGTQAASSTADQGSGNYIAYPLYIGRRGGASLPFNGHLYSLIVRFGPNPPIATIEQTEKYINTQTRAY